MRETMAYLGLGSNLGQRREILRKSVEMLGSSGQCKVDQVSSLYLTRPVGVVDQPDFLNAVVAVKTTQNYRDLLELCKDIERKLGRKRTIRWGPRVIDIDILLYGDTVVCDEDLTIPHKSMMERAFVLVPLAEIAPDLPVPGGGCAREAADLIDKEGVELFEGGSWIL